MTSLGVLVHNASWGDRLKKAGHAMPESIKDLRPHGHHVVMKGEFKGWTDRARRYVTYSQRVLKEYEIDIDSLGGNVHWAPNRGHSVAYAKAVADDLKAIGEPPRHGDGIRTRQPRRFFSDLK